MPFYDLRCTHCNNEFNIKASMEDRENNKIVCPECGHNELEAIFRSVNIIQSRGKDNNSCPHADICCRHCHM